MNQKASPSDNQSPPNATTVAAWLTEGTHLLGSGKAQAALPLLEKVYAADGHNFDAALNLSGACILTRRFKKAVGILEPLSAEYPDNAQVWTNLGAAYLGNPVLATDEQQQQAITAFKRALEVNPIAHSVAYNIGLIYRDRQETEEAKRWFRLAIKHDPLDQHARNHLHRLETDDE
jgi:tetratricopeptide (TPR) repeat protein